MLASDATIVDIAAHLSNPVKYVRGVLGNLYVCMGEHKHDVIVDSDGTEVPISNDVQVRIGVTGRGRAPHYRVERGWEVDRWSSDAKVYGIFDGRSHKTLMEWTDAIKDEHWSEKPASFDDVEKLLGELLQFKRH